ncbi:MAG: tyrosine--tRNA ligase, partial [Patescibacteria group bacterium]
VAQAIDSVEMDVDLEIGGSDQLFNMMAGRTLMKAMKGKEKFVLSMKLLVDKDGNKVGKTTGNALFMDSTPENFYAGVMSFPDEVLELAFELLTEVELSDIKTKINKQPFEEKKKLAFEVIKILWGENKANLSQLSFEKTFQKREFSANPTIVENRGTLAVTLSALPTVGSISQAKRLINQGAIDINGEAVTNPGLGTTTGQEIKIGKTTFIKIK